MDWNTILGQLVPALVGLAVVAIGGARVMGWARIKLSVVRLNKETADTTLEIKRVEAEARRLESDTERSRIANHVLESHISRMDRIEARYFKEVDRNNELEKRIFDLQGQVATVIPLQEQVKDLKNDLKQRDVVQDQLSQQHDKELQAANERAAAAEEKLAVALDRIRELEKEVQRLNERVKGVEQDIRATPPTEMQAVRVEPELTPNG